MRETSVVMSLIMASCNEGITDDGTKTGAFYGLRIYLDVT